jgi:hypothetical protein
VYNPATDDDDSGGGQAATANDDEAAYGQLDADTDAIVRGKWRVAFKDSSWSDYLTTQATAAQVREAIVGLTPLGKALSDSTVGSDVAVTRSANSMGTGWAWSITFFDDIGGLSLFKAGTNRRIVTSSSVEYKSTYDTQTGVLSGDSVRVRSIQLSANYGLSEDEVVDFGRSEAPVLLRVDGRGVYSTNKDAKLKLSMAPDIGADVLENATVNSISTRHAVATYDDTAEVLHLQSSLGALETVRWRSPRRLRLSFIEPSWRRLLEAALLSSSSRSNSAVTADVLNISLSREEPAHRLQHKDRFTYLRKPLTNRNGRWFLPIQNMTY